MTYDTLILGAGAAGLFCASRAGENVLVVDHARNPGEKIRISGGGRCNFTNLRAGPANYLSANKHFAKSALAQYTPADFVELVESYGIAYHEKTLGQLFCDGKATQIVEMLVTEARNAGADIRLSTSVIDVTHDGSAFRVVLERDGRRDTVTCANLVVATGGKSIPKMGATGLAYRIAADFGLRVTETRPGLVPFTFSDGVFAELAGVALPVRATAGKQSFEEAMLYTHRGLSGPAMLQISSYWREGEEIEIDLSPTRPIGEVLRQAKKTAPKRAMATVLGEVFPARLASHLADHLGIILGAEVLRAQIGTIGDAVIDRAAQALHRQVLKPTGTEGYRTAEVTLGGVDTDDLSSKTMQAKAAKGLYFIGESVDVTGWLGGYNFQWAWASAAAAGRDIRGW